MHVYKVLSQVSLRSSHKNIKEDTFVCHGIVCSKEVSYKHNSRLGRKYCLDEPILILTVKEGKLLNSSITEFSYISYVTKLTHTIWLSFLELQRFNVSAKLLEMYHKQSLKMDQI